MTPAQVLQAADLLAEHEEATEEVTRLRATKRVKIIGAFRTAIDADFKERIVARGTWDEDRNTTTWSEIGEFEVTPEIRKMLLSAPLAKLKGIEDALASIGVTLQQPTAPNANGELAL